MTKNKVIKTTLLNIDSSYRDLYAKNICSSNGKILPLNPLYVSYNSITINYPNHNLQIGDNIVIENVIGYCKIISNEFYLIKNFKYVLIKFKI